MVRRYDLRRNDSFSTNVPISYALPPSICVSLGRALQLVIKTAHGQHKRMVDLCYGFIPGLLIPLKLS